MTGAVLVRAYLVCSGQECEAELEVIGTPEEVEAIVCDCGLGMHVIGWPAPHDS